MSKIFVKIQFTNQKLELVDVQLIIGGLLLLAIALRQMAFCHRCSLLLNGIEYHLQSVLIVDLPRSIILLIDLLINLRSLIRLLLLKRRIL